MHTVRAMGWRMARAWRLIALLWVSVTMLGLVSAAAAAAPAPDEGILTIDTAQALLEPDGAAPREGPVDLARRWDGDFPGLGGRAVYRITLPPRVGPDPMALLFSRVGNQVHVAVNGTTVERWGVLGDPTFDAAKNPRMVALPAGLLRADRGNELVVEVTLQRQRLGGLSVLRYGPHSAIESLYDEQRRWREIAMVIFGSGLVGIGALTAVLWWRLRDPFYGWFSPTAFLGVVRIVDRAWPDVPLPWPLSGVIVASCYAAHIVLICRFTLMALGPVPRVMSRAFSAVIVLEVGLLVLSYSFGRPVLMTIGMAILTPLGLATLAVIVREARAQHNAKAWVLATAIILAMAAGIHDVVVIRIGNASGLQTIYSQHALFLFIPIMAWLIADRYSRSVANYHALNADLARRVAERERELKEAFDSLREQQLKQSVSNERQRIMREIHDGVGSQLVGLLNMVDRTGPGSAELKEQVQLALDEMRMSVDSLQPAHDDLATLLATLRYRLQPRLQAAGIDVVWDVAELPAIRQLPPHVVLHVQRILLEAFTNVMKHAHATCVTVRVRWRDGDAPLVMLRISDNGVGLRADRMEEEAQRHGHGIANMRARAAAIGAVLRVEQAEGGGVCVALEWQAEREPSASPGSVSPNPA